MNNQEISEAIEKWQEKDPENRVVFSILMDKEGYTTRNTNGSGLDLLAILSIAIQQNPRLGALMRMACTLVNENKQKENEN